MTSSTTPTDVTLDVGDTWTFGVSAPVGSAASFVVTDPDGDTSVPTPVFDGTSVTVTVELALPGRYLAAATVIDGADIYVTPFTAWASALGGPPTLAQVRTYLNSNGETSATDEAITEALAAEAANQRKACYVDDYGPDLAEALKRRVAKNLAARAVPIASTTTFDGGTTQARVQRYDAEVTRLESPYRRIVVG